MKSYALHCCAFFPFFFWWLQLHYGQLKKYLLRCLCFYVERITTMITHSCIFVYLYCYCNSEWLLFGWFLFFGVVASHETKGLNTVIVVLYLHYCYYYNNLTFLSFQCILALPCCMCNILLFCSFFECFSYILTCVSPLYLFFFFVFVFLWSTHL
jgi:hypothetical protein